MKTPRVLLVTSWPFPHTGGVGSHLRLLAERLGIPEERVLAFRQICEAQGRGARRIGFALARRVRPALGLDTVSLFARTLQSLIARERFDIAHCHDAMATWAALRARRATGRGFRVVSTVHGPVSRHMLEAGENPGSPDVVRVERCEREAWGGADAIIAVDEGQRRIVVGQGADPAKTVVIPNAVDAVAIERTAGALPVAPGDGRPWVVVPRRLAPKNGVEFAIRALALIGPARRPRLLLAGSGPERERLEGIAAGLGVGGDVVFLGSLDHVVLLPLVGASAVVLVPSVPVHGIEEATSIAALEAMALRRPVVASAIGGLCEIIRDGVDGVLVPPGDPPALAAALERLLADEPLRRRLGGEARARLERELSAEGWLARHRAVYEGP